MPNNSWFNIPTASVPGGVPAAGVAAPASGGAVGVITASQSAITFAGAPAAVTLVWKVIGQVSSSFGTSKVFPIVLALLIGIFIWWQTTPSDGTPREKVSGFIFALINSFAIAAAALGIESATTGK